MHGADPELCGLKPADSYVSAYDLMLAAITWREIL